MKKKILKYLIKLLLKIDNLIYRLLSKYVVKMEGGIHPKHRLIKYHDFFIDNIGPGDTVLDVGCGNGSVAYDVAGKARSVVGIDIDEGKIRDAKNNFLLGNIEYVCGDVLSKDFRQRFDVIILSNVLEHIENRPEFLKKMKGIANKLLIRVPMRNRSWLVLYKKELGIDHRLDKTHYIEYTLNGFKKEIKAAGLNIRKCSIQFGEIWAVTGK